MNFNFQVLPILSDRCYFCHGTDAAHRKGDLRLDRREDALAVIKPGDPAGSELVKRLHATDPDDVMPPPESHLEVTAEEKALLERWIAEGAEYKGHWAFQSIVSPPVPAVDKPAAPMTNEVDAFVAARLKKEGLALQPPAAPARLLRRLSQDLTGLPPTPDEVAAFEKNYAADAARAVAGEIDRLLASPHYGERMAVDWLDVARFADTFGYQSDVAMNVWPWRDWVIKALNENLPWDQFITWQLAGDLLPEATQEQKLATTFNRLHRQTNEGGSIEEEFRVEYVCDRVETYGLAFLGLTMQCAKCHDHKYDPVSQKDYYSLFAYFQNIDESGLYSHFTDAVPTPALSLAKPAAQADAVRAQAEVVRGEADLVLLREQRRAAFAEWAKTAPTLAPDALPGQIGHFTFDKMEGGKVANRVNDKEPGSIFDDVKSVPGKVDGALELSGENNVSFALGGKWTRDDAFSAALWLRTPDVKDRAVVFHRSKAWTDAASCGYELLIEDGKLSAALIHFWPGNALRVVTKEPLAPGQWTHVTWSYDGSSRARGLRLYVNGREAAVDVVRDALTKDINRGGEDRLTIGQRFRDRGFKGGLVDDFRLWDRAVTPLEARILAGSTALATQSELFEFWLAAVDEPYRAKLAEVKALRQARSQRTDREPTIMTMTETPAPKPAYVLFRGKYDERRDEVSARTPASFPPAPAGAPSNRLGLAQWTVAGNNPLTARVIVNRLWQSFFGRGFVLTAEDFGLQGALPTHPELLDFLARRFIDSGWDYKALVRFIVSSATYQQESACAAEVRAKDPENVLLSRGPSVRLSAEQIRDQAMAAAGVLDRTIGGPSVNPDSTNRRSLYTFWKRTMPDVRMEIFDMAKREVCTARRPPTNTPLQALTLLNEARFNEWAGKIATNAAGEPTPDAAIAKIFLQLTSRRPTGCEMTILRQLHAEQDPATALVAVAQAVMNFDEAVMKR